jgi:hypothetical protein
MADLLSFLSILLANAAMPANKVLMTIYSGTKDWIQLA